MREEQTEVRFLANREVRRVPHGWQHPLDGRGRPEPLLPEQMPAVASDTDLMAYETTSEGTPISPAFPDTPEGRLQLISYCAEHATTYGTHRPGAEAWAAILFGENAAVGADGTVEA